jgi:hypothetical protein
MNTREFGLALAVVALAACPARVPAPTPLNEKTVTESGTVQEIDSQTQEVTLRRPDGTDFTILVAPDLDDTQQLEEGDRVTLTFHQSVTFQVKKSGEARPGVAHTVDVTRAPHGEALGGSVTDIYDVRVPIAAVDKAASALTVRDSRGEVTVVKVPDAQSLDAVAVGDVMDITYTSALVITVAKPAP